MAAPVTYLYALVSGKKPAAAKAPAGLPGAGRPRLLAAGGGLALVVSTAPLELYDEHAIERGLKDLEWVSRCAVAHESVIEHFAKADALVPTKLFTIFHSDERALAHVQKGRKKIDAVLARVKGRVELGLRVALDPKKAAQQAVMAERPSSGAAFLERKKKQKDLTRELAQNAAGEAAALHDRLAALADQAVERPPTPGGPRLLLDAAYLVPRKKVAAFKSAVAREALELEGSGFDVTVTGPWPPYNFAGVA